MKYLVVLGDGMADYPIKELGNKTPLQHAFTPNMDQLAQKGTLGLARTIPPGMPPGSDVANLSVLGYDPRLYYTGRSPLEAISLGVQMAPTDVAFRCNLVTLSDEVPFAEKTLLDYSADEISTEEAGRLIKDLSVQLGTKELNFYPGISYRHVLVWREGPSALDLTPPHDISDRQIRNYLPAGEQHTVLLALMEKSHQILSTHPINLARQKKGYKPANSLWFWGQGKKPSLPSFPEKYGLTGSVVCAVDLVKGLGICAGLEAIKVPGATGGTVTNFRGKADAALEEFKKGKDFVYLHIEAPDEAGHRGELNTKIKTIEAIDAEVIGPILKGMEAHRTTPGMEDYRLLILPDHPTPIITRTHTADPVPFLFYQHCQPRKNLFNTYNEETARASALNVEAGHELMDHFMASEVFPA